MAINIQRGRDHGLPGYNAFRKFFGLPHIPSMDQKPEEIAQDAWESFQIVYAHPEDIDLLVGGLAEEPLPGITSKEILLSRFLVASGLRDIRSLRK